jgi:hypothetical protein
VSTAKITLNLEIDGQQIEGYPLVKRINLDEIQQFSYEKAASASYTDIPATEISNIQLLLIRPSQQLTIRLNGQSDAGIVLSANGILLVLDGTLNAVAANAQVSNASGSVAIVKGVAGGT